LFRRNQGIREKRKRTVFGEKGNTEDERKQFT